MKTGPGSLHYKYLKEKWIQRHKESQATLWQKHKEPLEWISKNLSPKQLALTSLGSLIMLTVPSVPSLPKAHFLLETHQESKPLEKNIFVVSNLFSILPKDIISLNPEEEKNVIEILSRDYGIKIEAEISGKRLERNYGYIGQEQHLARYPGDTLFNHFDSEEEKKEFSHYGMASGLGAWGYFAKSKQEFSEKDKMREKYYIAIQTFLAPGFMDNVKEYSEFFKYRKMIVVNPNNGHAVIAVIGDAGPALWTGKSLGGSPEVMRHLERVDGSQKGLVLYFFVDDPNDIIPLGPINPK